MSCLSGVDSATAFVKELVDITALPNFSARLVILFLSEITHAMSTNELWQNTRKIERMTDNYYLFLCDNYIALQST